MSAIAWIVVRWQSSTVEGVLSHLWQSTVVGLVILAVMFAARRTSARTRWIIGWIALIKFLVPVVWFTPLPVTIGQLNAGSLTLDPWNYRSVRTLSSGSPTDSEEPARVVPGTALAPAASFPNVSRNELGAVVWVTGAFFFLGTWWLRGFRFRRWLLVHSEPVSPNLHRKLVSACARVGLPVVPHCVAIDDSAGPGVLGVFSPVIVVPAALEHSLADAEIESVLIHELVHLRRRDTLFAGIQAVLVRMFWFNPVVWLLNRQLSVEMEKSCDEAVLEITSDAEIYAGGIMKMVRQSLGLNEPGFAGITSISVVSRIRNILAHKSVRHRWWPKFLTIGAATSLVAFSGFAGALLANTEGGFPPGKILVFRNVASWNRSPDFEAVLGEQSYPFDSKKSAEMALAEFSSYSHIVIPGGQENTGFYSDYAKAAEKFDRFVRAGGTLLLELNGAESEGITLPGGAAMVREPGFVNIIAQPHHPALSFMYTDKLRISANPASHGYLAKVPANATILAVQLNLNPLTDDWSKPTYVEYALGAGRVIGACQSFHNQDEAWRGPLMPAVLTYAIAKNWFSPDPKAYQEVSARLSAANAGAGVKLTAILKALAELQVRPGTVDDANGVPLAAGLQAAGNLTNAGNASPRAAVETLLWAYYHRDLGTLAGLIKPDPRTAILYQSLPDDTRRQVSSPEAMVAAVILYGDGARVRASRAFIGLQITGDNQSHDDPTLWHVEGLIQARNDRVGKKGQFILQNVDGKWMWPAVPNGRVRELFTE